MKTITARFIRRAITDHLGPHLDYNAKAVRVATEKIMAELYTTEPENPDGPACINLARNPNAWIASL